MLVGLGLPGFVNGLLGRGYKAGEICLAALQGTCKFTNIETVLFRDLLFMAADFCEHFVTRRFGWFNRLHCIGGVPLGYT